MKIPEETQENIRNYWAAIECRDAAIKLFWGEKRAFKYQRQANDYLTKVKSCVWELYPDFDVWHWYIMKDGTIEIFKGRHEDTKHE